MDVLNFRRDTLIITDQSRVGGILWNVDHDGSGTLITAGAVRTIEETYFAASQNTTSAFGDLAISAVALTTASPPQSLLQQETEQLASLVGNTPGLIKGRKQLALGPVSTSSFSSDGSITLDGEQVFRPAGDLRSRRIGNVNVHFLVATDDLSGDITPTMSIGSVSLLMDGPRLSLGAKGCAACAGCGLCSLCILCGEVNFLVGAVGATGAVGVVGVANNFAVVAGPVALASRRTPALESRLQQANAFLQFVEGGP